MKLIIKFEKYAIIWYWLCLWQKFYDATFDNFDLRSFLVGFVQNNHCKNTRNDQK